MRPTQLTETRVSPDGNGFVSLERTVDADDLDREKERAEMTAILDHREKPKLIHRDGRLFIAADYAAELLKEFG